MIKSCGFYLYHPPTKEVLIGKVSNSYDYWSIPKGRMENGEKPLQTAYREVYEEVNISKSDLYNYRKYKLKDRVYPYGEKKLISFLVICEKRFDNLKCNSFFKKNGVQYPEFEEIKWVSLQEIGLKYQIHNTQMANVYDIMLFLSRQNTNK